jgi:hypothetical protein
VFIVVSICLVIDSVRKLLDTPSYLITYELYSSYKCTILFSFLHKTPPDRKTGLCEKEMTSVIDVRLGGGGEEREPVTRGCKWLGQYVF